MVHLEIDGDTNIVYRLAPSMHSFGPSHQRVSMFSDLACLVRLIEQKPSRVKAGTFSLCLTLGVNSKVDYSSEQQQYLIEILKAFEEPQCHQPDNLYR